MHCSQLESAEAYVEQKQSQLGGKHSQVNPPRNRFQYITNNPTTQYYVLPPFLFDTQDGKSQCYGCGRVEVQLDEHDQNVQGSRAPISVHRQS
jgi:hypothetical protein